MVKLDLRYILEETSKSVSNGQTIEKLEEWRILLKRLDGKEDRKSLKQAINILEIVIKLKKKKNKTKGELFKQSFLFIMFLVLLVSISASITHNIGGSSRLIVTENVSTFLGEVRNIENIDGVSRFLELNLNNGTNAISAFTATNNLNRSIIMGITGGNFSVASSILVDDQPFIFSNSGNDMAFGVGSAHGFVWRNDLTGAEQYSNTTNILMTLNSLGDLNITNNLNVISNATIGGFLTIKSLDAVSPGQSTILRIDDATGEVGTVGGSLIVLNSIDSPTTTSGVNYVWDLGSGNNLTVDLHSSLDPDDPLTVVSHYFNLIKGHVWRLDPNNNNSIFQWESGFNNSLFTINGNGLLNLNDSIIISPNGNIRFPKLINCDTIDSDSNGLLFCGTDNGGGGNASIFGSEFEVFQSLSQSSTDDALINKLTATTLSKPTGTYRIGFFADATNSDGADLTDIQFLVDGSPIAIHTSGKDLYTMVPHKNNDWLSFSAVQYKVLASPSTIDVTIKFGTNDNTAKISNAIIEIWRVA